MDISGKFWQISRNGFTNDLRYKKQWFMGMLITFGKCSPLPIFGRNGRETMSTGKYLLGNNVYVFDKGGFGKQSNSRLNNLRSLLVIFYQSV